MSNSAELLVKNIGRIMADRSMKQKELAKIMGVHPPGISAYLRGIRTPSVQVIDRIAAALGTTTAELLTDPNRVAGPDLSHVPPDILNSLAKTKKWDLFRVIFETVEKIEKGDSQDKKRVG